MEIVLFTGSFEQEASTMDETKNKKPGKELQDKVNIVDKTANLMGSPAGLNIAFETPARKALMEENKIINEILESLQRLGIEIGTTDGEIGEMLENKLTLEEVAYLLKQHEAQFEARQKRKEPAKSKRKQAEESGAVINIPEKLALITKDYKGALNLIVNPKGHYITRLDKKFIDNLQFNKNGTITTKENFLEILNTNDLVINPNIKEIDITLLESIYTVIFANPESISKDTVDILLSSLARGLNINTRGSLIQNLFNKLSIFNDVIGVFPNGSFYKVLQISGYNNETGILTISAPYIIKILIDMGHISTEEIEQPKSKRKNNPFLNHDFLIDLNIASERDKIAVEIVKNIVTFLRARGKTHADEKTGVIHGAKKIQTIINEIPTFIEQLEGQTTADKNKCLKRHFKKAYQLLREKTSIYEYYENLKIDERIPTVSTTKDNISIEFTGYNKGYKDLI